MVKSRESYYELLMEWTFAISAKSTILMLRQRRMDKSNDFFINLRSYYKLTDSWNCYCNISTLPVTVKSIPMSINLDMTLSPQVYQTSIFRSQQEKDEIKLWLPFLWQYLLFMMSCCFREIHTQSKRIYVSLWCTARTGVFNICAIIMW